MPKLLGMRDSLAEHMVASLLICALLVVSGCNYDSNGYPISESTGTSIGTPLPVTIHGLVDETGQNVTPIIDRVSGAIVTIGDLHHEVHEGEMYSYCNVTDVANGANITFLFRTPSASNGLVNIRFNVQSEAEAEFQLWEDSVVSANGTQVTVYNHDRNSANVAASKVFHTPTITSLNTSLCVKHWGNGPGVGGGVDDAQERILKPDTNYIIRVSNFAAGNNHVSFETIWYLQITKY